MGVEKKDASSYGCRDRLGMILVQPTAARGGAVVGAARAPTALGGRGGGAGGAAARVTRPLRAPDRPQPQQQHHHQPGCRLLLRRTTLVSAVAASPSRSPPPAFLAAADAVSSPPLPAPRRRRRSPLPPAHASSSSASAAAGGDDDASAPKQPPPPAKLVLGPLERRVAQASRALTMAFPVWVLAAAYLGAKNPPLFAWVSDGGITLSLAACMLGMGLTLTFAEIAAVFTQRPQLLALGMALQYTVLPVVGWAISRYWGLARPLAVGVALVSCMPGGTASNIIALIAKGDMVSSAVEGLID